jgi:hypothetical protein
LSCNQPVAAAAPFPVAEAYLTAYYTKPYIKTHFHGAAGKSEPLPPGTTTSISNVLQANTADAALVRALGAATTPQQHCSTYYMQSGRK